jgi:hypothetical protein
MKKGTLLILFVLLSLGATTYIGAQTTPKKKKKKKVENKINADSLAAARAADSLAAIAAAATADLTIVAVGIDQTGLRMLPHLVSILPLEPLLEVRMLQDEVSHAEVVLPGDQLGGLLGVAQLLEVTNLPRQGERAGVIPPIPAVGTDAVGELLAEPAIISSGHNSVSSV